MSDYDLLHGSAETIADLLGCSVRTARRYKNGSISLPEPSRRLLQIARCGDLSAIGGKVWAGFVISPKWGLSVPGWRNPMLPEQLTGMFFTFQEAAALRAQVKELKSELWAMQSVRRYTAAPNSERIKP